MPTKMPCKTAELFAVSAWSMQTSTPPRKVYLDDYFGGYFQVSKHEKSILQPVRICCSADNDDASICGKSTPCFLLRI